MHPTGILPLLTRVPMFLIVTAILHKLWIGDFKLSVNSCNLVLNWSAGPANSGAVGIFA